MDHPSSPPVTPWLAALSAADLRRLFRSVRAQGPRAGYGSRRGTPRPPGAPTLPPLGRRDKRAA